MAYVTPAFEMTRAMLCADGRTVLIWFSRPSTIGAGGSGGFSLYDSETLVSNLSYLDGDAGIVFVFRADTWFEPVASLRLFYVQPGNGVETTTGVDLPTSDISVYEEYTTPTSPAMLSATVDATGEVLALVFDRPMTQGTGYMDADFNLDGSTGGADIGVAYTSGDGTGTHVYAIISPIEVDEVVNLDYNGRINGLEDATGNDLGVILNFSVTNNSTAEDCTSATQVFLTYDGWSDTKKISIDQSNGTVYAAYARELRRKLAGSEEFCLVGELSESYQFSAITIDQSTGILYAVVFDENGIHRILIYDEVAGDFTASGDALDPDYWMVEAICVFDGVIYIGARKGDNSGCVFSRPISGSTWSVFFVGYSGSSEEAVWCTDIYVDAAEDMYISWGFAKKPGFVFVYGSTVTKKFSGGSFVDILSFEDNSVSGLDVFAARRYNSKNYFVMFEVAFGDVTGMALYSQVVDGGAITKLNHDIENRSAGWDEYSGVVYSIEYGDGGDPGVEMSAFLSYSL